MILHFYFSCLFWARDDPPLFATHDARHRVPGNFCNFSPRGVPMVGFSVIYHFKGKLKFFYFNFF